MFPLLGCTDFLRGGHDREPGFLVFLRGGEARDLGPTFLQVRNAGGEVPRLADAVEIASELVDCVLHLLVAVEVARNVAPLVVGGVEEPAFALGLCLRLAGVE